MLNKIRLTPMISVIIIFATLGLVGTIVTNPKLLFRGVIMIASLAVLSGIFVYFFSYRQRIKNDELRKYRKAARQSQKRNRQKGAENFKNTQFNKKASFSKKEKPNPPHLRVIDGKKPTKNNPMSL